MTNREKFAEQILDITCEGKHFAMDKNKNITTCENIECSECEFVRIDSWCEKNIKKWCESEYIEKPKISESDRRFLDYIPSEEAWITRDKNGHLYLFCEKKPHKSSVAWYNETDEYMWLNKLTNIEFPMVKWEDAEPWAIEDLKNLEVENGKE